MKYEKLELKYIVNWTWFQEYPNVDEQFLPYSKNQGKLSCYNDHNSNPHSITVTSRPEKVLLSRSRNTEGPKNMAPADNSQNTTLPTNMSAEDYNNQPSWTLSYSCSPSFWLHKPGLNYTHTVYKNSLSNSSLRSMRSVSRTCLYQWL